MGLDITITRRKKIVCPKCGEVVEYNDVDTVDSGGRSWYPFLESIGYYVPYEQRTEENNWYAKDMTLTKDQVDALYRFVRNGDGYSDSQIRSLISIATYEGDDIVVNADW